MWMWDSVAHAVSNRRYVEKNTVLCEWYFLDTVGTDVKPTTPTGGGESKYIYP